MSGDVVARAKSALEGIRPDPWQVVGYGNLHAGEPGEHPPLGKVYGTANAAFVAEARSLVPELLAEVERLQAALHRVREMATTYTPSPDLVESIIEELDR